MSTSSSTELAERGAEYADLAPLFRQLADSVTAAQRREARTQLVRGYLPVAEHIARRFHGRGQPADDLTQVATLGLIHAVDRFDPERGTDFIAFAVPTITGELRRYFRDATWSIRVPRRLQELAAALNSATLTLSQRLGHAPSPSELARELGIPVEDVYEGLQARHAYRCDSLDTDGDDIATPPSERMGEPDPELDVIEHRDTLFPALAKLPKRQAAVVVMRFYEDLTQTQIANRIGVSQMQVSRLLSAALSTLRTEMAQH